MAHIINVYLIRSHDLRNEKIDHVLYNKQTDIKWTELSEGILATKFIPDIKEFGKNKTIAKITTDYFGGFGHQTAKLFIDNKKVYDKSNEYEICYPINDVLKEMGVKAEDGLDEFDTIGLNKYRSNNKFK